MIPRLVRFYGGDPIRWLAELPMAVVKACHRMVVPLSAEESLLGVQRIGVAMGADKGLDIINWWKAQADMASPQTPNLRTYPTADELRQRGFTVFSPKKAAV